MTAPRWALRHLRISVRVIAFLGLITFSFMLIFVVNGAATMSGEAARLAPPGSVEARLGAEHPGESVHVTGAVVALVIGASGLTGLILAPDRGGFAYQTLAVAVVMAIAVAITGNPDNHGGQAGAVDPAFLVMSIPPLVAALLARPRRRSGMPVDGLHLLLAAATKPAYTFVIPSVRPHVKDPHPLSMSGLESFLNTMSSWTDTSSPTASSGMSGRRSTSNLTSTTSRGSRRA